MFTRPAWSTRRLVLGLVLVATLLTSLPAEAASGQAPAGDGRFHVVGTQIVGPDGLPFVPRGVNKGGMEWRSDGYDLGRWNFERMRNWRVNVVRVALSSHFGVPGMCTYDRNYLGRIDQIVSIAEELRMLVILDNHHSTRGRLCGLGGWADQQKMADTHSQEFLRILAERYRDRPYVAFDLYNEPHDISDEVWRNGGTVDGWRAVGMQQLLDTVRSTGNTNLVFVSGNSWANDLRMVVDRPLANDANVVYAFHSYPLWCNGPREGTLPYWCEGRRTPPFLETWVAPATEVRAVMATEFGTHRSVPAEITDAIAWFEAHGVGWAAWMWCYGRESDFCLLQPTYDGRPTNNGRAVAQGLQANPPR